MRRRDIVLGDKTGGDADDKRLKTRMREVERCTIVYVKRSFVRVILLRYTYALTHGYLN